MATAVADRDALFWESVRNASTAAELRTYLERFPDGTFAALARTRIAALEAEAERDVRCDDLAGAWLERRDDRECASELWFEPVADGTPHHYDARTTVCPGPGALGVLGTGTSTGEAVLDGQTLTGTWQHGPCSGTSTYELDETCTSGTGRIVGTRGLFGTCAGIRLTSTLERVDPP